MVSNFCISYLKSSEIGGTKQTNTFIFSRLQFQKTWFKQVTLNRRFK